MKERSDEMAIASTRMDEYQQAIKPLVDMRMELHSARVRMVLYPDGTMVREYPDDVTRLDASIVNTMKLFKEFYFKSANASITGGDGRPVKGGGGNVRHGKP